LLVEAYDEAALSKTMCRDCFRRFKNSDFDVENKQRAGKIKLVKDTDVEALLNEEECQRRDCRIIGSCTINHFHVFKTIGNDLKVRKLGTV